MNWKPPDLSCGCVRELEVNGKVKAVIMVPADIAKEDAIAAGKAAVEGKITGNIVKEIYVPKKIVNLVVK